ncbi:ribosomal 40S subunit protein S13 [Taiwanofungus camphoratus]|nr:ribosomal 40S subunit protein S13 [Antrodia cinnamomea]KAI0942025.1 ribosomal 40S subunit protein S13 [Antrodia cinnamomea]KAI0948033.1 ribosomal 40S subunit protein S13 [Antrodia cinnamomea]
MTFREGIVSVDTNDGDSLAGVGIVVRPNKHCQFTVARSGNKVCNCTNEPNGTDDDETSSLPTPQNLVIMGRMHAPGKGISSSALPYRRAPPSWLKTTPEDVVEHINKLARKGLTPSQIGVTLRDSHGIPQVRFVTGNKILRILKSNGLAPQIPEDLWHLVKKAVAVRKHLETNRKDKDSKFRLILIESRIHRLARYYKTKQQIPPTFKYDSATASTLIA